MSSGTKEAIQFVVEELKLHPDTYIVSSKYAIVSEFAKETMAAKIIYSGTRVRLREEITSYLGQTTKYRNVAFLFRQVPSGSNSEERCKFTRFFG